MAVKIKRGFSARTLSLTPLVDVVFLLVIFFLVTSRFEQEERDMRVELPQASDAEPTIFPGREVFVTVTADGEFFLDGVLHTRESLRGALEQVQLANPGRQRVTIRADANARTGATVAAMNACNQANIDDYRLAAE
ncbi:MAG: biopolymer transporter ExbD [Planctomycetota bacterium]